MRPAAAGVVDAPCRAPASPPGSAHTQLGRVELARRSCPSLRATRVRKVIRNPGPADLTERWPSQTSPRLRWRREVSILWRSTSISFPRRCLVEAKLWRKSFGAPLEGVVVALDRTPWRRPTSLPNRGLFGMGLASWLQRAPAAGAPRTRFGLCIRRGLPGWRLCVVGQTAGEQLERFSSKAVLRCNLRKIRRWPHVLCNSARPMLFAAACRP